MGSVASWICAERGTAQVALIQIDGIRCMLVRKAPGLPLSALKRVPNDIPRFTHNTSLDEIELAADGGSLHWMDV